MPRLKGWVGKWVSRPAEGGVRIKVLGLGVIAAVPIIILAGVVIAQTYGNSARSALQTAALLEGTALARFDRAQVSLQTLLSAIHSQITENPDACQSVLGQEMLRLPGRVDALLVLARDGSAQCSTGAAKAVDAAAGFGKSGGLSQVRAGGPVVLSVSGRDQAPIAALAMSDGSVLVAVLPLSWFEAVLPEPGELNAATWLLDPAGRIAAVRGPARSSVATEETLQTLLESKQAAMLAQSVQDVPFAYATTRVASGWRLIEAYQATAEYNEAAQTLGLRMVALGVLLLMALVAITAGAGITFGTPLRRLSEAVSTWQKGGAFDPGPLAGAPREVRELARSFGEATAALRHQEEELARSKEQQDLLVLEIHHRVKNNLQIVASLLNLQASRIRAPDARAEFQAARDRVRALATLHRHLYSDGELHTINMRSFLVELCGQLFQAMGETADDRITLSIEAPELRMSSDQAVPLALIVTEAVTNSVKYAFPNGRRGRIAVRLSDHSGVLDLVIEDDGVGIPPGSAQTEAGTRDGIGRQLIRGFARQLGASLAVEEGQGTRYAVRLSLKALGPPVEAEALDAG